MLCPFLKIEGVICDRVILAADLYADPYNLIIQNNESSERDRIPICISHTFLRELSLGMAVRKLFWFRLFKGSGSHSFRDSVKFQTGHRGIN